MPENVLRNIIEFKLGEPEYIKLKHSKGLREIQRNYKPKQVEVDTCIFDGDKYIEECTWYIIKPKCQETKYVMSFITKQKEKIREYINQSNIIYLQPDMFYYIELFVESLVEYKSKYDYEENEPYERMLDYDIEEPIVLSYDEIWNDDKMDDALWELQRNMFSEVEQSCGYDLDDVLVKNFCINIRIFIDTEEYK